MKPILALFVVLFVAAPGQLSAGGGHVQPIPSCTGGQLFAKSAAAELCFV